MTNEHKTILPATGMRRALEQLLQMIMHYSISDSDYGIVCNAAAALAARPEPAGADERGWLIEVRGLVPPTWLTADAKMVADAGLALRFARQQDAEGFLAAFLSAKFGDNPASIYKQRLSKESYVVTEHIWHTKDSDSEPAGAGVDVPTPQKIADDLAAAKRGATCPMCGWDYPHQHTPREITIFRNGIKWSIRNEKHSRSNDQGDAQDAEDDAGRVGEGSGSGADQHNEHRAGQSSTEHRDACGDSDSNGIPSSVPVQAAAPIINSGAGVENIDTPEFRKLLDNWWHDQRRGYGDGTGREAFVAHIDAHVAAQVAKAKQDCEARRRQDHEQACQITHALMAERDAMKATQAAPQAQQPVASGDAHWLDSPQSALSGKSAREGYTSNPEYSSLQTKATPAPEAGARDAALEEAAALCDEWEREDVPGAVKGRTIRLAGAIRTLKTAPAKPTTKEIELAMALGRAEGTLRFVATVCKDGAIVKQVWSALEELKFAPAKPAQDLVAAIKAMRCLNPFVEDNCRLYNAGFLAARSKAAALVAAHLKGTP